MVQQINGHSTINAQEPQLPGWAHTMLQKMLGVDPAQLLQSVSDSIKMMQSFCVHFDGRMVAVEKQLAAQTAALAEIHAKLEQLSEPHRLELLSSDLVKVTPNGEAETETAKF